MFRPLFTLLLVLAAALGLRAEAQSFGPLVTPAELAMRQDEIKPTLLDIRGEGYDKSHIPGAISAPYGLFRGPANNPGAVPAADQLQATYRSLGLELTTPIVVVSEGNDDTDFGAAARVYWTLKSSGFTALSVLNGGQITWEAAGFPTDNTAVTPALSDISISFSDRWLADTAEVERLSQEQGQALLVDARPEGFFNGQQQHTAAARPGTLPGAVSLPYTDFFAQGRATVNPQADAGAIRQALGLQPGQADEIISFCNTGHWAATNWFVMSELAGLPDVKLYPGSMVEYSQTGQPMDHTPGLFQNALRQLGGGK